tara:strand:+ start:11 stop:430 length:420 start_codon:yes stop_codon:yes gene_type:complete
MKKPNLNNFGKQLKFKQKTKQAKKQKTVSEKELFIETMNVFSDVWNRSNDTYEKYKINLLEYEEQFYQIIESFVLLKYGFWKTELILWYIFSRLNEENEVIPILYKTNDGEEQEEIILNNPSDLWDFLKKVEESNNDIE